MGGMTIRPITADDDEAMGAIVRDNLAAVGLDIPGTAFFDPEIIAVGGGVSGAGEFLLQPVREKLKKLIFYKDMPYAEVKLATMGNDAGIVGAAMLGKL